MLFIGQMPKIINAGLFSGFAPALQPFWTLLPVAINESLISRTYSMTADSF